MKRTALSLVSVLGMVAIFGSLIGAIYAVLLPRIFPGPGWGTYSPLIVGIVVATLAGGCIGYKAPATNKLAVRIGVAVCFAVIVGGGVSWLALFIILNTRGS